MANAKDTQVAQVILPNGQIIPPEVVKCLYLSAASYFEAEMARERIESPELAKAQDEAQKIIDGLPQLFGKDKVMPSDITAQNRALDNPVMFDALGPLLSGRKVSPETLREAVKEPDFLAALAKRNKEIDIARDISLGKCEALLPESLKNKEEGKAR